MSEEIKEILLKFNKEVEKVELTRNPYSTEDKKLKHILVSLSEEHFSIFKDILDYITNLQKQLQQKENIIKEVREYIKEHSTTINFKTMRADYNLNMNELLEILDKVD